MPPTSSIIEDVTYCPATSPTSDGVQSLDFNKTVELHTYSLMEDNLDTTIKCPYMRTDSRLEGSFMS